MSKTKRINGHSNNGYAPKNRLEFILDTPKNKQQETNEPDLSVKKRVQGKTPNHRIYIKAIKNNDITFCTGPAGTGKTHLAIGVASQFLSKKQIERIILVRPAVPCEEDLGHLPGDLIAKLGPYLRPAYDELMEFFTQKQLNIFTEGKFPIIEGVALGQMKGRTFKNALVILDEAQDATYKQLKNFLTRIGDGSTLVISGDLAQSDKYDERRYNYDEIPLHIIMNKMRVLDKVECVEFTKEDIVRHPRIEKILEVI